MRDGDPASKSGSRIIRILLLLIGAAMIAYALSDDVFYGGEPGFGAAQALIAAIGAGVALSALLSAGIAGRILLVAIAGLVALAGAEVAGEILLGPRYRPIYKYDDRLIFKFIPNRWSVMTRSPINGGQTVMHHINSQGFRGEELLSPGAALRVVVYGDSFIHAFYCPEKETFVARLGAMLSQRLGKQVEAVNAGVSSYGPDQESLKMESELPRLRPALVVAAIFAGNDYGDLMRNKIFRLGAEGKLVANRWSLDPKVRMLLELSQHESILKRAFRDVLVRYRGGQGGEGIDIDTLLRTSKREYRSFIVERDDTVTNIYVDYYSANISLEPRDASSLYEIALMHAVMRRIRDVAARDGVPLVFLLIPHPADVADRYDDWRIDHKRFPDYVSRNQIAPLEDAARDLGVPYVSLYDAFRSRDANSLYFHGGDDHWNAAGQLLAAQMMTDYLVAHNILGRRAAETGAPGRYGLTSESSRDLPMATFTQDASR